MKFRTHLTPILTFILLLASLPAGVAYASGGMLYVSPNYGMHSIGDTFQVQVLADTGGVSVNGAEASIIYNPDSVAVLSISTDGSILSSWPTPPTFSNKKGTITFSGVAKESYSGSNGLLVTISLRAISNMVSDVRLESGDILAADGVETNIITSMHSGIISIQPQQAGLSNPTLDATDTSPSTDANTASAAAALGASTYTDSSGIPAPVLSNYKNDVQVGERIVVGGTAPASSTISVWIQEGIGIPQRTDLTSGSDGAFTYVSDTQAEQGIYHVWAYTLGVGNAISDQSNKIQIMANPTAVAATATFATSLISEIMPFLALLIFGGLAAGYLLHRHSIKKLELKLKQKQ